MQYTTKTRTTLCKANEIKHKQVIINVKVGRRRIRNVINVGGPPDIQQVPTIMKQHALEPVKPN